MSKRAEALNLIQIIQRFPDAESAREYLERLRWPHGAACPKCGGAEVYRLTPRVDSKRPCRKGLYKCAYCRKQFTVTVGTIFEDSHIPLNKWLIGIYLMCSSKKGISAHQIHRMLKMTYRSAWFMCHRIRYAMEQPQMREKMLGVIEVDEAYIGGKRSRRKIPHGEGGPVGRPGPDSKMRPVLSLLQRGGEVRSFHLRRVTEENVKAIIREHVDENSAIHTDELNVYKGLNDEFGVHERVFHKAGEYWRYPDVTTNSVEGFFSLLKRGIHGTFHHVGEKHLHRYLAEFDFRYNARKIDDGNRTQLAIAGFEGKRLKYRD